MNKKAYIKPEQRVVELRHRTTLLAGSYGNQKAVQTYDDEEDIITDKGSIW